MTDEMAAISTAIWNYLDGLYEGDVSKLASVFHPASALTFEENGVHKQLSRDDWLNAVRNRPTPKSLGLERHDEILLIDQATLTMAFVKLRCAIPPRFFTDYLCLLKVGSRWQIVQKVFAADIR